MADSATLPKRSLLSAGFWARFLGFGIAGFAFFLLIAWMVSRFSEPLAVSLVSFSPIVAFGGSWQVARGISKSESSSSDATSGGLKRYYFRDQGYFYGPHTMEHLRTHFASLGDLEITEDTGQSQEALKHAKWKRLSELGAASTQQ